MTNFSGDVSLLSVLFRCSKATWALIRRPCFIPDFSNVFHTRLVTELAVVIEETKKRITNICHRYLM